MLILHAKVFCSVLALSAVILLSACAGVRPWEQIAQSEGLTLEEKLQELVSRRASRSEVYATFGYPTGYTPGILSYTAGSWYEPPKKASYPLTGMLYPDPEHVGDYRWVLTFDHQGSIDRYRCFPVTSSEANAVYRYLRDQANGQSVYRNKAYQVGFATVRCMDTKRCLAAGGAGLVLETSDGGKSWVSHASGIEKHRRLASLVPSIYSMSFPDSVNGWLVGHDSGSPFGGVILHSSDGGKHWSFQLKSDSVLFPRKALWSIHFNDKRQGWAVGNRGVILKTTDGGKEWKPQSSGTREDLLSLSFVDADHGWIGGTFGTILHTGDGGDTWTKQCLAYAYAGKAADQIYWHPWLK